ncbi:MAG TPA: hypothetical protein VET65_12290 [Candidatus Limnocylindrales bacterium]|nr:hypothetical protein [Candidatus Limnocylindrales bacterium]
MPPFPGPESAVPDPHLPTPAALQFVFTEGPGEELVVVFGRDAARVAIALFGAPLPTPLQLTDRAFAEGAPAAAICWKPPDRLEIRIPASGPWAAIVKSRLRDLERAGSPSSQLPPFRASVEAVIARVEAWYYADTEQAGGAEELARDLSALQQIAPTAAAAGAVNAARDALDDGMPADAIVAALYRAAGS